jgi:phosphatidylserine/phosphatidylglycerophosphate/cardiolipin synthase-like enzyme
MTTVLSTLASSNGLTVKAYIGDCCVMLAFNLEDHLREHLAGFALRRRSAGDQWQELKNRLSFSTAYTSATTTRTRKWFATSEAPFQKFWWVDFPPENDADYEYEVTVMRFLESHNARLKADQQLTVRAVCRPFKQGNFQLAFTRGYLSSQAYHDRFRNADIRPEGPKTIDFDTRPFQKKWAWLGASARRAATGFLVDAFRDKTLTLDVFAYDLDEPDFIDAFKKFGKRLRIIVDDAPLHTGPTAPEPHAIEALKETALTVMTGNFDRYQHNKVFIVRKNGVPIRVLTGSTNFSVAGLYVNANHVAIFDDPEVARLYADAFDAALENDVKPVPFRDAPIAGKEFEIRRIGLPATYFSFAPHQRNTFSLDRLVKELEAADSSVLFAVMALKGSSKVLDILRGIHEKGRIFSYGVTDDPGAKGDGEGGDAAGEEGGVTVYSSSQPGVLVKSAALNKNVPPPFDKELQLGLTHKVHHKFVVIDFNDSDPVVFFGSSNLAKLGVVKNGDNLVAIYDRAVATVFAIEAIKLVDHYAFRAAMSRATDAKPMRLKFDDEDWARNAYTDGHIKQTERLLFSK